MKKAVSLLIAVLLLLTVFGTGCSQKTDETESKTERETETVPEVQTTAAPTTEKEELWRINEVPLLTNMIYRYFDALKSGDEEGMRNVLISEADIDPVYLIIQAKVYEEFQNIRIYSCPGMNEGETCLFVLSDVKFVNIDTPAPKSYVMYAREDQTVQKLRLMMDTDMTNEKRAAEAEAAAGGQEEKETAYSWYVARFNESAYIMGIYNDAIKAYNEALSNDRLLSHYIAQFKNGDYAVPTIEESTTEVIETTPEPTEPTTSTEETTEPTTSVEETTEEKPLTTVEGETLYETPKTGFVSDNGVRVRSAPKTGVDNVLIHLNFPHRVLIVGEVGDWYHIRDVLPEDGTGKAQNCSGLDGYIVKEYVMEYDAQQP